MIGKPLRWMTGQPRVRNRLKDLTDDVVPQRPDMLRAVLTFFAGQPEGFSKTDDVGHILCSRPQASLLPPAGLRRLQVSSVASIQRTDSLGSVELMCAKRKQIHVQLFNVDAAIG